MGLEDLKEHLQNAFMDKISHAYIINGEKDSGKMMLAEAFAATLLCERKGKDACMECRSCRQARAETIRISSILPMRNPM